MTNNPNPNPMRDPEGKFTQVKAHRYPSHCFNPHERPCWMIGEQGKKEIDKQWERIRERKRR
jgi:hypothetical protein